MGNNKYYFITEAFYLRTTCAIKQGCTDVLRSPKTVVSLTDFNLLLIFSVKYHPHYAQKSKPQ